MSEAQTSRVAVAMLTEVSPGAGAWRRLPGHPLQGYCLITGEPAGCRLVIYLDPGPPALSAFPDRPATGPVLQGRLVWLSGEPPVPATAPTEARSPETPAPAAAPAEAPSHEPAPVTAPAPQGEPSPSGNPPEEPAPRDAFLPSGAAPPGAAPPPPGASDAAHGVSHDTSAPSDAPPATPNAPPVTSDAAGAPEPPPQAAPPAATAPEPPAAPVPEPTPEPTAEPVPESTPEPTAALAPEPSASEPPSQEPPHPEPLRTLLRQQPEPASPPPGAPPGRVKVALQSRHPLAARAIGQAQLDVAAGSLSLTLRALPNPVALGREPHTNRPYNAYRVWLLSSRGGPPLPAGLCTRVWGENYRFHSDPGLPLSRYDSILITAEDRTAPTPNPHAPGVLQGRYHPRPG